MGQWGSVHDVDDLEVALLRVPNRLLPREDDHGEPSEMGVRGGGGEVGRTGAEGGEARGRVAGQTAHDRRHEAGRLLVPRQDELERLGGTQAVEEVEVLLTWDAEAVFDALSLECLHLWQGVWLHRCQKAWGVRAQPSESNHP